MTLSAREVRSIFRRNRITIREAAAILNVPMTRVRHIYRNGTTNPVTAWEFREHIPKRARERRQTHS